MCLTVVKFCMESKHRLTEQTLSQKVTRVDGKLYSVNESYEG